MYNTFDNCEFKHTFDELYADTIASGKHSKMMADYRNWWEYFSEAKTEEELMILRLCNDRRTKDGKWAGIMKDKYGVPQALWAGHKYQTFVKREQAMNRREGNT